MEMYSPDVRWPTRYDYDLAMEDLTENMQDLELRRGHLDKSIKTGFLKQYGLPDALTCLYRIDNWMIRCFCRADNKEPNQKITDRYRQLSRYSRDHQKQVSALVPFDYIEKGIKVDYYQRNLLQEPIFFLKEDVVPIVKMPFVQGLSLGSFIAGNYNNTQVMKKLSAAWQRMIQEMEQAHMAHGDLDLTNVRVQEGPSRGELTLKLIDYDNTWIPDFENSHYTLPELGHEHFQHPDVIGGHLTKFNETIDRFASLVIYISLQLLVANPKFYTTWQMSENRLLFTPGDYKEEQQGKSERISQLRNLNIPGLESYIDELSSSLRGNTLPRSVNSIAAKTSKASFSTQHASESFTVQPDYNPKYREVLISDWVNIEYISKQQQVPVQPSQPLPSNEKPIIHQQAQVEQQEVLRLPWLREHQDISAQAPVDQPEVARPPRKIEEPQQPIYTADEEPVQQQKRFVQPAENLQHDSPQEPIRLQPTDNYGTQNSNTQTRRAASERTPQDTSYYAEHDYVRHEGYAKEKPNRQALTDPATLIGCGIILFALLLVIAVILLIVHLGQAHSGGLLPPVHQVATHMIAIRAVRAPLSTYIGGSYV